MNPLISFLVLSPLFICLQFFLFSHFKGYFFLLLLIPFQFYQLFEFILQPLIHLDWVLLELMNWPLPIHILLWGFFLTQFDSIFQEPLHLFSLNYLWLLTFNFDFLDLDLWFHVFCPQCSDLFVICLIWHSLPHFLLCQFWVTVNLLFLINFISDQSPPSSISLLHLQLFLHPFTFDQHLCFSLIDCDLHSPHPSSQLCPFPFHR